MSVGYLDAYFANAVCIVRYDTIRYDILFALKN